MSKGPEDPGLFTRLTLGVVKTLEKRQGVCDVKLEEKQPVDKHVLTAWEQKYSCLMPDDVKDFYLTSNGFRLKWNAKMNETRISVGRMELNSIDHLVRIGGVSGSAGSDKKMPSLSDITGENDTSADGKEICRPRFDHRSRIFELDPCDGYGKVCLVYNNTKPDEEEGNDDFVFDGIPAQKADIWFLDRALQWYPLAQDFQSYFRLMLMHLGLPFWQYAFTDIGLPPQAKQWFNMYAPIRLDLQSKASDVCDDSSDVPPQSLDVAKVFKGKSDKKKQQAQLNQVKRRPGAPSARTQTFVGRSAAGQTAKGPK